MTYEDLRIRVGRRPITVVELDLDFCANAFGVAPCTAAGSSKCFNTYASCQDTPNFARTTKTYRFTTDSSFLPIGETIFPCVSSVDLAPVQIDPKGFAVSGSVSVELRDFPHHDRGIDPYASGRPYDPAGRGTFFGRLRGRNPYVENRVIRVCEGYIDDDRVIYSRTRTYFIDRIEGPDADGRVRIYGKDALRFADAEKAQAPKVSKGSLAVALDTSATSLTLTPAGVGAEYPDSGTVRIEDEVIRYAGRSGDTLMGLIRGSESTESEEHDAAEVVQLCIRYSSASIPFILNDLLVNYAGIDPAYIPLADWNDENDTWMGSFRSTVLLSEPKGIRDLVKELGEASGSVVWWDDIEALMKFRVLTRPLPTQPPKILNELEHFLAGSITVKELTKERVSQVVTYFMPSGATVDLKAQNFRSVSIQVDTTGEGVNGYGTSSTRTILNRWVPSLQIADEVGVRLLQRYKDVPRQVTFTLDAKDAGLTTGDLIDISSRLIQDFDGTPRLIRCLVTECRAVEEGSHYQYVALQASNTLGTARLIAPDGTPDWTAATMEQRNTYMFISNDAGLMSDGSPAPLIT